MLVACWGRKFAGNWLFFLCFGFLVCIWRGCRRGRLWFYLRVLGLFWWVFECWKRIVRLLGWIVAGCRGCYLGCFLVLVRWKRLCRTVCERIIDSLVWKVRRCFMMLIFGLILSIIRVDFAYFFGFLGSNYSDTSSYRFSIFWTFFVIICRFPKLDPITIVYFALYFPFLPTTPMNYFIIIVVIVVVVWRYGGSFVGFGRGFVYFFGRYFLGFVCRILYRIFFLCVFGVQNLRKWVVFLIYFAVILR